MVVVHDFIVVGSGMSGAHSAQTLVEENCKVLMLDVGIQDDRYKDSIPDRDFLSLRKSDHNQHRYFLGDDFEGIPWGEVDHALTPPRQHLIKETDQWLPFESGTFNRMESLAYGGLGAGWGAGCAVYPDSDLLEMGLDPEEIRPAYKTIAKRIGVAAQKDDITPYCSRYLENSFIPVKMDHSIREIYQTYSKKRERLNAQGIHMGKVPMAVLTRDLKNRKALQYKDLEFWTDHGHSVYRAWMSVDELRGNKYFSYKSQCLVLSFREENDLVKVVTLGINSGTTEVYYCRKLILASGVLATARIVLRSFSKEMKLPILTNPYAIVPCIHLKALGETLDTNKTSLGQLEMIYDESNNQRDVSMVSMYTYRSLLLFKLIKEVPFNMADSLKLLSMLASSLVIATINHPDQPSPNKYVELIKDSNSSTGDFLKVRYKQAHSEKRQNIRAEKQILKAFLMLGCLPLVKQKLKPGSSVHYAGTLPFNDSTIAFSLSPDGKVGDTKNVYVADGSGFRYLPACGLTFTVMAYAHLVAKKLTEKGSI